MTEPAGKPQEGLGRAALFGAASQILGRGARAIVGVGTVAVLSRFMGPSEFGIAAMILFVMLFAQLFSDFGLRVALVQKAEVTELEMNSVFWFSVGIGAAFSIGTFLGAEPIARAFQEPRLAPYLQMIAGVFVISSARGIPMAILERSFRFPAVASSEVAGAVAGGAAAIAAAFAGYKIEALVLQQIVMTVLPTAMNFVSARWLPRLKFSPRVLAPMMGFGASMTATAMIGFLAGNIDRPILATRLSAKDLGIFTVAGQIVLTPQRTIAQNAKRVTFPILSSFRDDLARVATAHRDSLHAMFLVLAPICFGLAALAEPFTGVLLGPQWATVGQLVGVAAVTALLWSIGELNSSVFMSQGAARFLLWWSLFSLASSVAVLLLVAPHGLLALVWARLVWSSIDVPLHCWFLGRRLGTGPLLFLRPLWRPVFAAAGMGLLVAVLDRVLMTMGLPDAVRLMAGVPAGVLAYSGLILLVDGDKVRETARRVRGQRGRRG